MVVNICMKQINTTQQCKTICNNKNMSKQCKIICNNTDDTHKKNMTQFATTHAKQKQCRTICNITNKTKTTQNNSQQCEHGCKQHSTPTNKTKTMPKLSACMP